MKIRFVLSVSVSVVSVLVSVSSTLSLLPVTVENYFWKKRFQAHLDALSQNCVYKALAAAHEAQLLEEKF